MTEVERPTVVTTKIPKGFIIICLIVTATCLYFWHFQRLRSRYKDRIEKDSRDEKATGPTRVESTTNAVYFFPPLLFKPKKCTIPKFKTGNVDSKFCVNFNTLRGPTRICTYSPKVDSAVSRSVRNNGTWREREMLGMEKLLSENPKLNLIDVGCNIGVFTLLAAKYNRRVVAVDDSIDNIRKVQRSLQYGNFENLVTVVHNVVSDGFRKVQPVLNRNEAGTRHSDPSVKSIFLDDLLEVVTFKNALLKINLGPRAFLKSSKLFDIVDIQFIFMDWDVRRHVNEYGTLRRSLTTREYRAYGDPDFMTPLTANFTKWPSRVFWRKAYPNPVQQQPASSTRRQSNKTETSTSNPHSNVTESVRFPNRTITNTTTPSPSTTGEGLPLTTLPATAALSAKTGDPSSSPPSIQTSATPSVMPAENSTFNASDWQV